MPRTILSCFGVLGGLDQQEIRVSGKDAGGSRQATHSEATLRDSFQVFSLSSPQSFIDDTLPCYKIKQNQKAF